MRPTALLALFLSLAAAGAARADTERPVTEPEAAPEATKPSPAPPPKIAIIVAGDPDASLRDAAASLERECTDAGLRTPADPALRGALVGDATDRDDGLDGVRALRRSLGVNPRKDLASYRRLGSISGADALVVLRREGDLKLEVLDVSAGQFYEGMLDFEATTPEARAAYVKRRAETAQERWDQAPPVVSTPPTTATAPTGEPADEPTKKRWIKKAWPYLVVGALLAGGVTYIIVDQRRTNDPGPPLLRFRPGDQ